jgi:hypothetical protein
VSDLNFEGNKYLKTLAIGFVKKWKKNRSRNPSYPHFRHWRLNRLVIVKENKNRAQSDEIKNEIELLWVIAMVVADKSMSLSMP